MLKGDYLVLTHDLIDQSSVERIDYYKVSTSDFVLGVDWFPTKLTNLRGRTYEAATFLLPPFTYTKPGSSELVGFEVRLSKKLIVPTNWQRHI